ncbi:MAG: tol-pal system-associated acyl-CoA thioesterase [Alphaproteobacteria bacterium]|nr:tol-pal system-associated acyl-CoA thioesterase [Alphaproteobacteria bacterium]
MTDGSGVHHLAARVYYEDTDAGGIVYHANFLRFAERGRTEYLRALGFDHHQVRNDHNLMLVVRHIEIDYRAPGKLDDTLDIATEVLEYGNTSLTMRQAVRRGETVLADMKVVCVAVGGSGKAVRIPEELKRMLGDGV